MFSIQSNIPKIYAFAFFNMFLVVIPVIVPFFKSYQLGMQQIFELQAIFSFVVTVFEVPSGYLSDIWGRKRTLVVGGFLAGVGFTCMWQAKGYWGFVLYEVVVGVGFALISGTDLSMLYDSMLAIRRETGHSKVVGNLLASRLVAESIASVIGGILVLYSFGAVVFAQALVGWIPFLIALTLVEPPFERMQGKTHWKNFSEILTRIFRDRKRALIFWNLVFYGFATFIMVWMFQPYWQAVGVPLAAFGYLWAGYNILVAGVGKFAHLFAERFGLKAALCTIGTVVLMGYGMMSFSLYIGWGLVGVGFGLCFQISRGFVQVILRDLLNQEIPSSYRATANSLTSLGVRLAFCVLGPIVGYCIDGIGLMVPIAALGVVYIGVTFFLLRPLISVTGERASLGHP